MPKIFQTECLAIKSILSFAGERRLTFFPEMKMTEEKKAREGVLGDPEKGAG